MNTALIVVDVQNDFCEGGSLAIDGGIDLAARIAELLNSGAYDIAVATRDHHIDPGSHFSDTPDYQDSWPRHCVADTEGAQLKAPLRESMFDAVFRKGQYDAGYSGFEGTDPADTYLGDWLREHEVDTIDVCGLATDFCVRATALDGARNGLSVTVLRDFSRAATEQGRASALEDFAASGVRVT